MNKLYKKSENYLNFTIETWYLERCEAWFYEIRQNGNFIKSNWYGLVSSGAAVKTAREYIDAQTQFTNIEN
jgi:hypothetical protein